MTTQEEGALADKIVAAATAAQPKKRGNKKGRARPSIAREFPGIADDDVLLTADEVAVYFGGPGRPLDLATIYRHAAQGLIPLPVKVGPRSVRWLRSECREKRRAMIDARGQATAPAPQAPAGWEAA
jgi:predicted DNA-binding transcriptional regulator AlpA